MLKKFSYSIDQMNHVFFRIASFALLAMSLLVLQQVAARYFFKASSVAIQEWIWHLFSVSFMLAIPYALQASAHVRVDIVSHSFTQHFAKWVEISGLLFVLIPVCLTIVIYGWDFAALAYDIPNPSTQPSEPQHALTSLQSIMTDHLLKGERSPDPGGLPGRWIIKAAIPFSFLLTGLQGLSEIIKKLSH